MESNKKVDDDTHEARRAVLLRLVERERQSGSTQKAIAGRMGVSESYLTRMLKPAVDPTVKRIGETTAKKIEDGLDLPTGTVLYPFLDAAPDEQALGGKKSHTPLRGKAILAADATKGVRIPLLSPSLVVHMALPNDASIWSDQPHVRADRVGPIAETIKGWAVTDTSMAPMMKPGDVVFVDPTLAPQPGRIVLCECRGEYMLREYIAIAGGVFEARALGQGWATLRSDRDGVTVLASKVGMTSWD